jgi:hypothetical protein
MGLEVSMRKKHIFMLIGLFAIIINASACHDQETLNLVSYSKKAGVGYIVAVDKDYAYVTNNDGVAIFDIHQPERLRKVGEISTGVTFGIFVENGLAYISGEHGLVIADVHDPENPKILNEHVTGVGNLRVHVEGSSAYLTNNRGLEILDVSNPGKIISLAHFGSPKARGIDVSDGIAYLASFSNGVEVLDMNNPATPKKITTVAGTKGAWDVHIHNDTLYVGCHGAGIVIVDITDKKSPRVIGRYRDDDSGEALGVWGDDTYVYVADNFGIEVLDVSDLSSPYEIGEYSRVSGAHDIYVEGEYLYVAEGRKGLMVFQL